MSPTQKLLAPLAALLVFHQSAPPSAAVETAPAKPKSPVDIGSRVEMFVDDWLIAEKRDVALKLHDPVRREVVLVTDRPWEGVTSAYFSVVQDGPLIRLYYRGSAPGPDSSEEQVTCVAESRDGIHFERPTLGLVEVNGSKDNNIVWKGIESHNFAPFLDSNPSAKKEERYKALAGIKTKGSGGLYAFGSADGLRWKKLREDPVMTQGAFDSLNLGLWDATRQRYLCYSRIFSNKVRAIQSSESADFIKWSPGQANQYDADAPPEHFYTSATNPCPGAPHHLLAFPKRFVPNRKKVEAHPVPGVSDAVFMSSRDGLHWDRSFLEAWVRPGPDEQNWTDRSNMPARGIVETGTGEFSMYISEHYRWPDNRLRRITVRRHGFASVHAGAAGGEFTTRPLIFSGKNLVLNYATSAAGSIQVELLDDGGKAIPGFSLADIQPLFGDELDAVIRWKAGGDLSSLKGKAVRLRFVMKDADLFALRFAE